MDSLSNYSKSMYFVLFLLGTLLAIPHAAAQDRTISGTESMSGSYNYDTFTVESGATVNLNGRNLNIDANEISVHGSINGYGEGYAGGNSGDGSGPGGGPETWANSGGGGYGAQGGCGPESGAPSCAESGGNSYGSRTSRSNIRAGSGGGGEGSNDDGGAGGGSVSLEADTITVSGSINMDGQDAEASSWASYGGGGGSGGGIIIDGGNVDLSGASLSAEGGDAGNEYGGSGAGGRIKIFYGTLNSGYSTNTNGVDSHTYGGDLLEHGAIGGDGTVYTERISNPDNPTIQNLNFNRQAGNPATIDGSFDVNIDHDDGNAPNNQLESCTVTAEGVDSGGQVNLNTNINGNSCSFSVDNNDHGNWNPDEELRFDMSVEDSYSGTDNLQSFSQFRVNPPNAPALVTPSDGAESVSTGTSLEVRGRHPDGLNMDIRFYLDDGSGFTQVGPTRTATDGEEVSVSPGLNEGTDYTWYAEAETQGRTTESSRWDFETNYRPTIGNMQTSPKNSGHRMSFTSTVTDQDGGSQIDGCELEASGGGSSYTYTGNVESGAGGPDEARCSVDNMEFNDASWSHLQDLDLELAVTDSQGLTDTETGQAQFPNHEPVIETLETREYTDREAFEVNSLIRPVDVGSDEMRGCTIVLSDEDNSYTAGSMTQINSTHVRCEGDDLGPSKFPGLDMDEELEVTVRATDIHGSTSSDSVMFNLPTGIDYQYSAMIVDSGGVDFLPYQVSNNGNGEAEFRTELRNVEASFTGNGQDSKTFTLDSGELESSEIRISPEPEFTGTKDLRIVTENLDTGVKQESTLPIYVRNAPTSTERPVPGIGAVQLLALVFAALTVLCRGRLKP